jgi:cytochrome c-type biogenesis protein
VDIGDFSSSAPLVFALTAGMAATVNPCGFVMLPAFVSYQLGERDAGYEQVGLAQRLRRAVALGVTVTLGFVVVFAGVGLVLASGGRVVLRAVPWAGLVVGVVLVLLGLAFLIGKGPLLQLPAVGQGAWARDVRARFIFGIGYAVASLGCTLPIFLAVLASSLTAEGVGSAGGAFFAYAAGMGLVLTAVAVGAVLVRGALARVLRRAGRYLERASALLLMGAGGYLVVYYTQAAQVLGH